MFLGFFSLFFKKRRKKFVQQIVQKKLSTPHMKKNSKGSANRWNVSCRGGGYLVRIHKGQKLLFGLVCLVERKTRAPPMCIPYGAVFFKGLVLVHPNSPDFSANYFNINITDDLRMND